MSYEIFYLIISIETSTYDKNGALTTANGTKGKPREDKKGVHLAQSPPNEIWCGKIILKHKELIFSTTPNTD